MIVSIIPIITAILAHFLLEGEKLRLTFFIGFLAAAAALVFACYSIFIKKLSVHRYHIIELTQRIFLYGLLFMVPALFLFDFHLDPS